MGDTVMTSANYRLIAEGIRAVVKNNPDADPYTLWSVTGALAYLMAIDNPRFDRDTFYEAAGINRNGPDMKGEK